MPNPRRRQRLSDLLREELSDLLRRQVKDPRLGGLVTVTEVALSPDLKYAKVFISVLGSEGEKREALQGFAAASGFFRRELGNRLSLRYIPELTFYRDDSLERGDHLLRLISQVSAEESPL